MVCGKGGAFVPGTACCGVVYEHSVSHSNAHQFPFCLGDHFIVGRLLEGTVKMGVKAFVSGKDNLPVGADPFVGGAGDGFGKEGDVKGQTENVAFGK